MPNPMPNVIRAAMVQTHWTGDKGTMIDAHEEYARQAAAGGCKGAIAPGADADITIYDPQARTRIGVATHHMNLDHSAYEGFEVSGGVDTVLSRGKVILAGGAYSGRPGHGRFVKRGPSQYLV